MGDGGIRKFGLIDSWVLVPPIEKLGKSNGRTRKNYEEKILK